MVTILPITVVNEPDHPVEFDVAPIEPQGKTYAMQIRQDPASTGAAQATFTPTIVGSMVRMVGDCSSLVAGTRYYYDLEENGVTICTGTVAVTQQVTK